MCRGVPFTLLLSPRGDRSEPYAPAVSRDKFDLVFTVPDQRCTVSHTISFDNFYYSIQFY